MEKKLSELVHELDHSLGCILSNKESIEAITTELSHVREDVGNTDQTNLTSMGLRFRDISHKIVLLDDLINFVLKDLNSNFEAVSDTSHLLFHEIIKEESND